MDTSLEKFETTSWQKSRIDVTRTCPKETDEPIIDSLSEPMHTVVGIDVGGKVKGFHAVELRNGTFKDKTTSTDPCEIFKWCLDRNTSIVAVDAPCGWSKTGSSREAERNLELFGQKIFAFAAPTRERAENNANGFYDWMFNGENLYMRLRSHYPLFDGRSKNTPICFETFPQAVVCAMKGSIVSAKSKATKRRVALKERGFDVSSLSNIDFVDAALCAVAAYEFSRGNYQCFGNPEEGFIVVPSDRWLAM